MVIVSRGSAEKKNVLPYRGDISGTIRKRIDGHYERLIAVLYKVQVHTGTREMAERNFHNSFSHNIA